MKVKALEPGFYGGSMIGEGQEFDVPSGTKARWFTPVEEFKAPAKAAPRTPPKTLSEMAKAPVGAPTDIA